MRRRRPGRWLAPLALVVVAIAVWAIVQGNSSSDSGSGSGAATGTTSSGHHRRTSPARTRRTAPAGPASYTVAQGDTLSAIAGKTGVTLDRLRALNPGLNESNLHIGQRIRLRR